MSEVARNFITQFHNIPGETVKEKQQSLFKFLHRNSSLTKNQRELDFIAANLKPTCHLEKIFRVDFLIYFRRFKELYEDFKSGDDITSSKLSKQDWFFQNLFKDVDAHEFVHSVLPTLPYTQKLKILKKLRVDEAHADEIFDALHKRYGSFLATVFLPKCTINKILETLKNHAITLTVSQLQMIYKKNPDLIPVYFEEKTKHEGNTSFMNGNPILIYIAQKNPDMFSELFDKYKFKTELGHRTTKRYIASQKNNILNKPETYIEILNKSSAVKKLGPEIKGLLFKESPESSELYWKSILKYFPRNQQFNIYKSTFDATYFRKFGQKLDVVTEDLLKIIPDPEKREELAKLKLEEENDTDYLKYVTPKYCLKEFMEKLAHMTITERAYFVEVATYCCVLNKDMDHLLKVCELVCVRFKNDDRLIRENFFTSLTTDITILDKFTMQHWKFVMEIVAVGKAKSEWLYKENEIRSKYVVYLIKNNKDIKEIILKYSDWDDLLCDDKILKNQKLAKRILMKLIEIGPPKPNPEEEHRTPFLYDCMLAAACKIYNENNPEDTIDIFKNNRIFKSVKQLLETDCTRIYISSRCRSGVKYMVCRKSSSKEVAELKQLYFKAFKTIGNISILMWFLKREPKTLQDNFDHVLENFTDMWGMSPKKLWRFIKKYSYLELDNRTVEFCKLKLKEDGFIHKKVLAAPLSILSEPNSYVEFIKAYIPTDAKVDLNNEDEKDLYFVQEKLVRSLHFIKSPAAALPVALQFCKGDYLQFGLSPLYSCAYNLPENETKTFIEQLDKTKAVSVTKHAMHLSCVIYDVDTVYECLKNATVPSLIAALRYFKKNPSNALWELVETKIYKLEKNDLQILKWAMNMKMPFEYKSKYIETVWKVLDKYDNKELQKMLLENIDKETTKQFNTEFAYQIIKTCLFKFEEADNFIANLLIHLNDSGKFVILTQILTEFKENCWNIKDTRLVSRSKLNKFIASIFKNYMQLEETDKSFASEMSTLFKSIFSVSEAFSESILLSCMALKGETIEKRSKLLAELNNFYTQSYGMFAINWFFETIQKHVMMDLYSSEERMKVCYFLFKIRKSVNDSLLVIMLLPPREPEDIEHFLLYDEILTEMGEVQDDAVQLQFNYHLKLRLT